MIRLLALACLALLAAGCAGASDQAASPAPAETTLTSIRRDTWETVLATLRPGIDSTSSNPCQSGHRRCLDLLLEEMDRRITPLASTCDHDALFAVTYRDTTRALARAVDAGRFEHPESVTHLSAWFARAYFTAFDRWQAGDVDAVPEAWRLAFEAADGKTVRSIGDVLLGMNAHISRDLPFIVADVVRDADAELADYTLFSRVIEDESDRAIGELADRFDPDLVANQVPLVLGGRPTLGAVIAVWRTDSWLRGVELIRASAPERSAVAERIEAEATRRAELLLPSLLYPPLVDGPGRRDRFCAAQRGH